MMDTCCAPRFVFTRISTDPSRGTLLEDNLEETGQQKSSEVQ
jgi:hypothetical protein